MEKSKMHVYDQLNRKELLLKLKALVAVTLGAEFPMLAVGMQSPVVFPFGTFDMYRVTDGDKRYSGVLYLTWAVQPEAKVLGFGFVREATDMELRATLAYYTDAVQQLRQTLRQTLFPKSFFDGLMRQAPAMRPFVG